jgi:hypothetical protein
MITVAAKTDLNSLYGRISGENTTFRIERGYDSSMKQKHRVRVLGSHYAHPGIIDEMKQWVNDTFGAKTHGWWNPRWSYASYGIWHFKNEADATFFILRWS